MKREKVQGYSLQLCITFMSRTGSKWQAAKWSTPAKVRRAKEEVRALSLPVFTVDLLPHLRPGALASPKFKDNGNFF